MSILAGLFQRDGRPVDPATLAAMLRPLGTGVLADTAIAIEQKSGLGRGWFDFEASGLCRAGDVTVVYDGRLDNRGDLVSALGKSAQSEEIGDAALVAAAWQAWGEDCPLHLLGDFAFALWDAGGGTLFLACDHFAVKTIAYVATDAVFAFASSTAALRRAGLAEALDEDRVAELLGGLAPPADRSVYRDIRFLGPGGCCTVSASGVSFRRYWALAAPEPRARRDAPEEFRHIFTEAVATRMGATENTGSFLSGGLDSSSIARVAARLRQDQGAAPLRTYSLVFDKTPEHNERPFVEAALAGGGCDPRMIPADDLSAFSSFDAILDAQDAIFLAPNFGAAHLLHTTARRDGMRVLLDGHGGDETVSHGIGYLGQLAAARQWPTLWKELQGFSRVHSGSALRRLLPLLYRFEVPGRVRRPINGLIARWMSPPRQDAIRFMGPGFARRIRPGEAFPPDPHFIEAIAHHRILTSPLQTHAFRVFDHAAAATGISLRYPMWDKRLVEFCLSLEPFEKLQDGWPRLVLRKAMEGILPKEIQWRPDKFDFAMHIVRGMVTVDREIIETVLIDRAHLLDGYVNLPAVRNAYRRVRADPAHADSFDVQAIWRTVAFGLWRRKNAAH